VSGWPASVRVGGSLQSLSVCARIVGAVHFHRVVGLACFGSGWRQSASLLEY